MGLFNSFFRKIKGDKVLCDLCGKHYTRYAIFNKYGYRIKIVCKSCIKKYHLPYKGYWIGYIYSEKEIN